MSFDQFSWFHVNYNSKGFFFFKRINSDDRKTLLMRHIQLNCPFMSIYYTSKCSTIEMTWTGTNLIALFCRMWFLIRIFYLEKQKPCVSHSIKKINKLLLAYRIPNPSIHTIYTCYFFFFFPNKAHYNLLNYGKIINCC